MRLKHRFWGRHTGIAGFATTLEGAIKAARKEIRAGVVDEMYIVEVVRVVRRSEVPVTVEAVHE